MIAILPPIKRLPPNSTDEERMAAWLEYKALLIAANPGAFDPDGNLLLWWRRLLGLWR